MKLSKYKLFLVIGWVTARCKYSKVFFYAGSIGWELQASYFAAEKKLMYATQRVPWAQFTVTQEADYIVCCKTNCWD